MTGPQSRVEGSSLSETQVPYLMSKLEALLPYSIPLFGRIQFHLDRPKSPTARIFVALAPRPGDPVLGDLGLDGGDQHSLDTWLRDPRGSESSSPWIAAHIDLANPGQTQVWSFASWEVPNQAAGAEDADAPLDIHRALMKCFFTYVDRDLVPLMPLEANFDWLELKRTGKYLTTPYSRNKVLFGTLHVKLLPHFPEAARARTDQGYLKYIFNLAPEADGEGGGEGRCREAGLPEGYRFGEMRSQDLQRVLDRTVIPRTLTTLRQLVSVALFFEDQDDPIGWGFLGRDASISSLHTEPEHRGKGLAVALSGELLRRQRRASAGLSGHHGGQTWAHADVSETNTGSRRVMEKLGGAPKWRVAWTEIDLEKLLHSKN